MMNEPMSSLLRGSSARLRRAVAATQTTRSELRPSSSVMIGRPFSCLTAVRMSSAGYQPISNHQSLVDDQSQQWQCLTSNQSLVTDFSDCINSTMFNPLTPTVAIWVQLAIKHPVPERAKPSFVIFDIRALWRSALSVRVPGYQKIQMMA